MRYIYSILIFLLIAYACNKDASEIDTLLNGIEAYIEEHPEEALKVLESVNREELTSRKLKAKHSLLYSMALDKNYIDVTNDSIIAPAVDYYKYHGTAEEKLLTFYYRGVIYLYAGDTEQAMKKFVEAERHIASNVSKKAIARLYNAKMVAYQSIFEYSSALTQGQLSARFSLEAKDSTRYFNVVNDIVLLNVLLNDSAAADNWLEVLLSNYQFLTEEQKSRYHAIQLNRAIRENSNNIQAIIEEYLSKISDHSIINWLYVAEGFRLMGDYQSSLSALQSYILYGGIEDAAYFWGLASLYEDIGDVKNSLIAYKKYVECTDNTDVSIFNSDTKFIEERYIAEIHSIKQRLYITIISLSLVAITLILIILAQRIKRVRKERQIERNRFDEERRTIVGQKELIEAQNEILKGEKEEVERMYSSLKSEIEQLRKIRKDKSIDKDILASVEQRLNVLNMFILAELSDSFEKIAYKELGKLMENREEFLESTRKTFMVSHPKFMEYLRKKKLTEWEIGCCCLYCIGFNGAEISEYLNRKAIYNVNSTIRQKLDIPKGGTQIDVFLKQKIQEYSS